MRVKRDINSLTNRHLKAIDEWLKMSKSKQRAKCPFINIRTDIHSNAQSYGCFDTCGKIFPMLVPKVHYIKKSTPCPCEKYEIKYVRKVARQILKERGYKNES